MIVDHINAIIITKKYTFGKKEQGQIVEEFSLFDFKHNQGPPHRIVEKSVACFDQKVVTTPIALAHYSVKVLTQTMEQSTPAEPILADIVSTGKCTMTPKPICLYQRAWTTECH